MAPHPTGCPCCAGGTDYTGNLLDAREQMVSIFGSVEEAVLSRMVQEAMAAPAGECPICPPFDVDPNCQHHGPRLTRADAHAVDVLLARFDRSGR